MKVFKQSLLGLVVYVAVLMISSSAHAAVGLCSYQVGVEVYNQSSGVKAWRRMGEGYALVGGESTTSKARKKARQAIQSCSGDWAYNWNDQNGNSEYKFSDHNQCRDVTATNHYYWTSYNHLPSKKRLRETAQKLVNEQCDAGKGGTIWIGYTKIKGTGQSECRRNYTRIDMNMQIYRGKGVGPFLFCR